MGFVDDVNALVPLGQVKRFLDLFDEYGKKLGANLNTEKTKITTTTSGESVLDKLDESFMSDERDIGV